MQKTPRILPWISIEEWKLVYTHFYSNEPHLQKHGVDRVKAWRSRGKLPHSVDITASLIDIKLLDISNSLPSTQIQLLYSMVFTRFVNGVVDPAQQKPFAMSITGIAEMVGLPSWFVDLRHAATHDTLPSLQVLRSGCSQALEWLNISYWQLQQKNNTDPILLRTLLLEYKECRKTDLKSQGSSTLLNNDSLSITKSIKDQLSIDNYQDTIVPLLIECIVPVSEAKRCQNESTHLPPLLCQIWLPFILNLQNEFPLILNFIICSIVNQTKTGSSKTYTLLSWARQFIPILINDPKSDFKDIKESILRNPTPLLFTLLESILPIDSKLFLLYKEYTNIPMKTHDSIHDSILSNDYPYLNDRLNHIKSIHTITPPESNEMVNGWFVFPIQYWKTCKLGLLNNKQPFLNYELDLNQKASSEMDVDVEYRNIDDVYEPIVYSIDPLSSPFQF